MGVDKESVEGLNLKQVTSLVLIGQTFAQIVGVVTITFQPRGDGCVSSTLKFSGAVDAFQLFPIKVSLLDFVYLHDSIAAIGL